METILAGKSTFKLQVPYKLIQVGEKTKKPLLVYFHGFAESMDYLETRCASLLELDAYHLFIQGPYPIKLSPKTKREGFSYYIYDEDSSYIDSLEYTSEFIQEVIDHITSLVEVSRLGLVGYSMGAYLAGYWAFSRWKHTSDLVMINGRLKTELFKEKIETKDYFSHLNILALNGLQDIVVEAKKQQIEIELINQFGLNGTYIGLDESHKLSTNLVESAKNWLINLGYRKINENPF